jgi:hypothetical protein
MVFCIAQALSRQHSITGMDVSAGLIMERTHFELCLFFPAARSEPDHNMIHTKHVLGNKQKAEGAIKLTLEASHPII